MVNIMEIIANKLASSAGLVTEREIDLTVGSVAVKGTVKTTRYIKKAQ